MDEKESHILNRVADEIIQVCGFKSCHLHESGSLPDSRKRCGHCPAKIKNDMGVAYCVSLKCRRTAHINRT